MTWMIAGGCLIAVGLVVGGSLIRRRRASEPQLDAGMYEAMVELYAIKRRFDVFQFKVETRQAEAQVRRLLSKELHDLRQREREL